ncbi:hypothetical protein X777_07581 [Ooceraea biroi]|nr:hypothetical protein X777_07581 [Ooceraea biroi]
MAEIVQMFLFLYKSKYRRKGQWRRSRRGDDDEVAVVHDRDPRQRWHCDGHGSGAVATVPWVHFLLWAALACWVVHVGAAAASSSSSSSSLSLPTMDCDPDICINGECVNGTCVCREGWQGTHCQFCGGKVR